MKIKRITVQFILEASKNAYPREFAGLLRAEKEVITEVLVFPGTEFAENHSSILTHMIPLDPTIVGSVHSHPGDPNPSCADLKFFEKNKINLIAGYPYDLQSLAAFDSRGKRTQLEIVK